MLKKIAAVAGMAAMLSVSLTACKEQVTYEPTESSLYVMRDGSISEASMESFTKDYYDADELKEYVEKQVIEYNQSHSDYTLAYADQLEEKDAVLPVAIEKCEVADGTATLILDYATIADYVSFNENAMADAYFETCVASMAMTDSDSVNWIKASDYSSVTEEEALSSEKMYFVGLDFATTVQVQGTIVYASDNCNLVNDYTFSTDGSAPAYVVYKK